MLKKKKRFLQWQCLNSGLAGLGAATNPNLYLISYDTLPFKRKCAFEILINTGLLVAISNILELEHKMNPICQSCLRQGKKNISLTVGISPDSSERWARSIGQTLNWESGSQESFFSVTLDQVTEMFLALVTSFAKKKKNSAAAFRLKCFSLKYYKK